MTILFLSFKHTHTHIQTYQFCVILGRLFGIKRTILKGHLPKNHILYVYGRMYILVLLSKRVFLSLHITKCTVSFCVYKYTFVLCMFVILQKRINDQHFIYTILFDVNSFLSSFFFFFWFQTDCRKYVLFCKSVS